MISKYKVRPWQASALKSFETKIHNGESSNFLCVATPGAGKTTFALVCARQLLSKQLVKKVIIIVPSAHLKEQWADAGADLGILFDTNIKELSDDSFGVIATYQGVAANPKAFSQISENSLVILDEIHHAGDDKTWGDALRIAFTKSDIRLLLSGTPFRSDVNTIPFVTYKNDELQVDYEYGYADALRDGGVVRPINFTRLDGHMEWIDTDGEFNSFSFAQSIDTKKVQQRLNVALNKNGSFLYNSLKRADTYLNKLRLEDPTAGALVICIDHEHAKEVTSLLRKMGSEPTVVLSDDIRASLKISEFTTDNSKWLVAVRMVSEGVDIPRLRVGVFATNTTTELFFRQAVGRFVRLRSENEEAMMYIPNDPRIVAHAQSMAESRIHVLKRNEDIEEEQFKKDIISLDSAVNNEEQLSMFQVLSSTHIQTNDDILDSPMSKKSKFNNIQSTFEGIEIDLPPLPYNRGVVINKKNIELKTLRHTKKSLRALNTEKVRIIASFTGEEHVKINSKLNTLTGIASISSASIDQLEKRLTHANKMLTKNTK